MHTACVLIVSPSMVWAGGVSAPRGYLIPGGLLPAGCLVPGVSAPRGGYLLPGGCLVPGGLLLGGCLVETPQDGHCWGRYASYWNAFLFTMQWMFSDLI